MELPKMSCMDGESGEMTILDIDAVQFFRVQPTTQWTFINPFWSRLDDALCGFNSAMPHVMFNHASIMLHKNAPIPMVAAINDEWRRLTARYGELNPLQDQQCLLIDKMMYMMGQLQEAVASSDIALQVDVLHKLNSASDGLVSFISTEYIGREVAAGLRKMEHTWSIYHKLIL